MPVSTTPTRAAREQEARYVWAWKDNPNGMFADWNPRVSCEEYEGE